MTFANVQKQRGSTLIEEGKEGIFNGDPGGDKHNGKPYSHILQDGKLNLYHAIRDDVLEYFKQNDISWWRGGYPTGNTVSSQIACLNHLFPIRDQKDAVLKLLATVSDDFVNVLPISEHLEGYIQFEAVGGDTNFLN